MAGDSRLRSDKIYITFFEVLILPRIFITMSCPTFNIKILNTDAQIMQTTAFIHRLIKYYILTYHIKTKSLLGPPNITHNAVVVVDCDVFSGN